MDRDLHLRVLFSYWYYKDVDLDSLMAKHFVPPYPDVFADSGAFSAMTQGGSVNIDEYAVWLHRWKHLFSTYANLDVIKDAQATWTNQQILEDKGLNPIPAFHVLEDFQWLERYVEKYPYMALGVAGMQSRRTALMRWLIQCFKIAGDHTVFHGFALTSWEVTSSFPWYSVDSSSWGNGFRFGRVPLFDDQRGVFRLAKLGDNKSCFKYGHLFRRMGFDPADFADRSRNTRAKICAISALSYMMAERWLRQRHGEIRIPGSNGEPGPKTHLVTADHPSSNHSVDTLVESLRTTGVKLFLVEVQPDLSDVLQVVNHENR